MSEVPEFPKIDTLFERGEDFKVDPANLVLRRPEFGVPERWLVTEKVDGINVRVGLEKTGRSCEEAECANLDCEYKDPWNVRFYGRTAAAEIPHAPGPELLEYLQRTFTLERTRSLWRAKETCLSCGGRPAFPDGTLCDCFEPYPIVLYGEGYGARIQKGGGNYRRDGDVNFRLFDVLIGGTWLRRGDVEDVARQLGIDAVPLLTMAEIMGPLFEGAAGWSLYAIAGLVRRGFVSRAALAEGTPGSLAEGVVAFTDPPLYNGRGQRLMWKLKTKDF